MNWKKTINSYLLHLIGLLINCAAEKWPTSPLLPALNDAD